MKFQFLNQKEYKDDNGRPISGDVIEYITTYQYILDGFYKWQCAKCDAVHQSRAHWAISGQVLKCEKSGMDDKEVKGCGAMNLLVKTNCDELDEVYGNKNIIQREMEELRRNQANLDNLIKSGVKHKLQNIYRELDTVLKDKESQI